MYTMDYLRRLSPETILQIWRELAAKMIANGHGSREEITQLNEIALIYGERLRLKVALSGNDTTVDFSTLPPTIGYLDPADGTEPEMVLEEQAAANPLWVVDRTKTEDHWLEINDGEGWYSAHIRWDGCIGLSRYFNHPWGVDPIFPDRNEENFDSVHICDIDDMILRLQALKAIAVEHFGEGWPR